MNAICINISLNLETYILLQVAYLRRRYIFVILLLVNNDKVAQVNRVTFQRFVEM